MMEARHTTDQLGWLEEEAAKRETKLAVERVDGHWRAGFVLVNRNGDVVYALNAVGPDEDTAIRRLAEMVDRQA